MPKCGRNGLPEPPACRRGLAAESEYFSETDDAPCRERQKMDRGGGLVIGEYFPKSDDASAVKYRRK